MNRAEARNLLRGGHRAIAAWNRRRGLGEAIPTLAGIGLVRRDLAAANLTGASLNGAKLSAACLVDADLTRADLHDTELACANLSGACLIEALLSGASAAMIRLSESILRDADLSGLTSEKQHCAGRMCAERISSGPSFEKRISAAPP